MDQGILSCDGRGTYKNVTDNRQDPLAWGMVENW